MSDANVSYIILPNSIVFNFSSRSVTVEKGTKMYDDVVLALKEGRKNDVPHIIDKVTVLKERCKGTDMHIEGNSVYIDGEPVDPYIAKKLIEFSDAKLPFQPLVNFWRHLKKNPSENSRRQLYPFLEVCKCPLTEDGQIISLKAVNATEDPKVFISKWDNRFKYVLGEPCREDRNIVEDNPDKACARGIHAGSLSYAKGYGGCSGIIIELLINPEHVVSVPKDHNNEKLRACEVLPLAVYQGGEYKKGIVVESTATEKVTEKVTVTPTFQETTVVSASSSTSSATNGYLINNQAYIFNIIEISLFDNFSGNNPDVSLFDIAEKVRFRASKAPAAVKRYASEHELSVYEAYRFKYLDLVYYLAVFQEDNDSKYCYVLTPVIEDVDTWSTIKTYLAGPVKEVEVEKVNPLIEAKIERIGDVVYCNDTYEVGYLKENIDVPAYVENDMAGFVRSLTTIKPSKMPIGLKNLLENQLRDPQVFKFYRLVLNDDALCFIVKGYKKSEPYTVLMRLK